MSEYLKHFLMTSGDQKALLGESWKVAVPNTTLVSIAHSSSIGIYVAVGYKGTIMTSLDGQNWTDRASGTQEELTKVAWLNNQFIAIGVKVILTSHNGIDWVIRYVHSASRKFLDLAYSGTVYVVVGGNGTIMSSTDSITWTSQNSGLSMAWLQMIIWNPVESKFFVFSDKDSKLISTDGADWQIVQAVAPITDIAYSPSLGLYIAFGDEVLLRSVDGINWTFGKLPVDLATVTWRCVIWAGTFFVAGGSNGTIIRSSDGVNWTKMTTPYTYQNVIGFAWNGSRLLAVNSNDGQILRTSDGIAWSSSANNVQVYSQHIIWTGGQFVVVGAHSANASQLSIQTSPDGITWTPRTSNVTRLLFKIAWNGSLFVAVGANGAITTSPDGITWTSRTSGTTNSLHSVTWTGSRFIATSTSVATLYTSTDGVTWTTSTSPFLPRNIITIQSRTFLVGFGGIHGSSDGVNWTPHHTYVDWTFKYARSPSLNLMVGISGGTRLFTSTNGVNWTERANITSATNGGHQINNVIWAGNQFVAVGNGGTIITSPNGIDWTRRTSNTTWELYSVAWSGAKLVIVGNSELVLESSDGITWNKVTMNTQYLPYSIVIWVNDRFFVWANFGIGRLISSANGVNWSIVFAKINLNFMAYSSSLNLLVAVGNFGAIQTSVDGNVWTLRNSGVASELFGVAWSGAQFIAVGANGVITVSYTHLTLPTILRV